jgi:hypothetical protein
MTRVEHRSRSRAMGIAGAILLLSSAAALAGTAQVSHVEGPSQAPYPGPTPPSPYPVPTPGPTPSPSPTPTPTPSPTPTPTPSPSPIPLDGGRFR